MAHPTSFLSRQCNVIASFLFGSSSVHTDFYVLEFFCGLLPGICEFDYYFCFYIFQRVYRTTCPGRTRCRDKDPCVEMSQSEYNFCIVLTPDQLAQLATPSYKLKKEKREAKKLELTPQ